jgi:HEAT repeat protein
LGKLRDARAVDALGAALGDDNANVREQAAWALGRLARGGR